MTEPVDVVILTKNSERMLRECIDSVYRNVPVNRLIVVDGYSNDGTIEIVKGYQKKYGNVVLLRDGGTRGSARQRAIGAVKTDLFMFVDSDVILSENWFVDAEKMMKDDVGALWGVEIWSVLRKMKILRLFERVTLKIFEKRGGTHDLLVRRRAVEGISVPSSLHTYEDAYIKASIVKSGYRVVGVYEPYCIHFRPQNVWTFKQSIGFIASDIRFAVRSPSLLLSYAVYVIIVVYYILFRRFKLGVTGY